MLLLSSIKICWAGEEIVSQKKAGIKVQTTTTAIFCIHRNTTIARLYFRYLFCLPPFQAPAVNESSSQRGSRKIRTSSQNPLRCNYVGADLTGQTPVLPVILTDHFWIQTLYFPYSCRLMLYKAAMISFFFGVFCCFALSPSKKKNAAIN